MTTYDKTIDILYVFNEGRSNKINFTTDFSNEFFYFFKHFEKDGYKTDFIEIQTQFLKREKKFLIIIEKFIRKAFKLPFYGSKLLSEENTNKLRQSKHIVLTNETAIYSTLFFFLKNKKFLNAKTTIFLMGITDSSTNYFYKKFKKTLNKLIFKLHDNLLFLSSNEKNYASKNYLNFKSKMQYFPFIIDQDFWSFKNKEIKKENYILFVGNDNNRDYFFLKTLANFLIDYKFLFISNNIELENFLSPNVSIIKGDWRKGYLTDKQLLKYYLSAKISIIPLKNSNQPSGQSVAMQSMSAGTPVIITETDGFWDPINFRNNEHIFKMKTNELKEWSQKIEDLFQDEIKLEQVSLNAVNVLRKNYNQQNYYEFLKNLIFN